MSCTELIEEIGNAPAPSTGKKGKKREWPFGFTGHLSWLGEQVLTAIE